MRCVPHIKPIFPLIETHHTQCPYRSKRDKHCVVMNYGTEIYIANKYSWCTGIWPFFLFFFLAHFHFPASGQAVVTGVIPSPPRFLPSIFIAHRVQQSHCSSIVNRMLLTHALALSASQLVHKKKSQRIYTSMHSAGLELTKLTYTRLEDNLIRHRGDRTTDEHNFIGTPDTTSSW